ncbi:MAG: hypothetical protein WC841_02325 [Candidatus Shapirobacteria bacterium]|jgi:hypothetical protein
MKDLSSKKQTKTRVHLSIPAILIFIYSLITIYFFYFKSTSESYSLTQSWKEYYALDDWNLCLHAQTDIDGDGQKDIITCTSCAILSSVSPKNIPTNKQCQEPGMSSIVFPDNTTTIGQNLTSSKPFLYQWPKKSYFVKTQNNVWKHYEMNGLQLKTYELGENNLFIEVKPTISDIIDTFTYQISHLGLPLVFFIFSIPTWFHS